MSSSTSSRATMPKSSQGAQHPLEDCEPLLTRSMLKHISPDQKEKYAQMLKEDGNALYKEKKFNDAISFYSAAIAFKEDPIFYSNRSACYVGLKDYQKVIDDTTKALELQPDFMKCLVRRAAAYEKLGKNEDCVAGWLTAALSGAGNIGSSPAFKSFKTAMRTALNKIEKDVESQKGLHLPSPDHIFEQLGGLDRELTVEGLPEDPSKLTPDSGDFYLISGMKTMYIKSCNRYVDADAFFTKALSAYKREVKEDPTNDVLRRKLGVAHEYVFLFKWIKGDGTFSQHGAEAKKLNPTRVRLHLVRAHLYMKGAMLSEAEPIMRKALKLAPKSGEVNYYMGRMFERMHHASDDRKDLEEAYVFLKKSKLYRPDNVYNTIHLLRVSSLLGDDDEWQKLEVWARHRFIRSPEYINYRGELLLAMGEWPTAMGQFQMCTVLANFANGACIRTFPLANAARLLTSQESTSKELDSAAAMEMLEKAIRVDPRSDIATLALGRLKLQQGKLEEGAALYKKAIYLSPDQPSRTMIASLAFSQSVVNKLQTQTPDLYKKLIDLKLEQHLPSMSSATIRYLDELGQNCPCCGDHK